MKVRSGKTPLLPRVLSLRQATTESGQIVSTIWDAESSVIAVKIQHVLLDCQVIRIAYQQDYPQN